MPKIIFEDIKFNKKTILKNKASKIPLEKKEFSDVKKEDFSDLKFNNEEEIIPPKTPREFPSFKKRMSRTPKERASQGHIRLFVKIIFIVSLIGGLFYWGGVLFHRATVIITARHEIINYKNKIFEATKNSSGKNIEFEIMIASDRKEKDFILTDTKEVSNKATGSIIIYNEFSSKQEKLAAGTYIVDEKGRTYKLNKITTVPGYKTEGKKIIPGQVDADITSFLAGGSYNGTPEKFYISSFKGTTKYSKIYGKLKTPLKGGIQGAVYYVTEKDKEKLNQIAITSFKEELFKQVKALTPIGYILYPNAINFSYKINEEILSENPETRIELEGVLSAILIKEDNLLDSIVKISLPEVTDKERKEVSILKADQLSFSFLNKDQAITKDLKNISFYLNGEVEALWSPNKEDLINKLAGVNKNEVMPIFRENKGITKALVKIFPPWIKDIPNNPLKINIKIK